MAITLTTPRSRAVVLPEFGGRLHSLAVDAGRGPEELLWAPADPAAYRERPTRGGSFPMAPWPNRVRDGAFRWQGREFALPRDGKPHANHGRVLSVAWEVLSQSGASCSIEAALDDGWPWRGAVRQRFTLGEDSLRMECDVTSAGEPFPAGGGWHPWFRRDAFGAASVSVSVPAADCYEIEANIPAGRLHDPAGDEDLRRLQPLGERRIDACYRALAGPVEVDWGRLRMTISVETAAPHVMVYTPPEAFCIEPQTCSPDAFNLRQRGIAGTGYAVAAPGEPVRFASEWRWERA
ncbi:MAG: hypothetical protein HY875_15860 [Chloroflexi bacterium]|nr:hypothetical protein [Chloroflexota bacterium]